VLFQFSSITANIAKFINKLLHYSILHYYRIAKFANLIKFSLYLLWYLSLTICWKHQVLSLSI